MTKTRPFVVEWPGAGRLGMMPRPAGGDWLADDLLALRGKGVDTLVDALTREDRERLDLLGEEHEAQQAGLSYVSFPITDFGVPNEQALWLLSVELAKEFEAGRFVVAHCFGGIGRSGTIVGATLIRLGASAGEAMEVMSTARGFSVPETDSQREMLQQLDRRKGQRA